jgi:hypothetical protein
MSGVDLIVDDLERNVSPVLVSLMRLQSIADYLTVDDVTRITSIVEPIGRAIVRLVLARDADDDAPQPPAQGVGVRRDT